MPNEVTPQSAAPTTEDTPLNQLAVMRVYRDDQLKMERRLAAAEIRIAQLTLRVEQLEGKRNGWAVKPAGIERKPKRSR